MLNNRIVVCRAEKGWTQQDLGERVGASRQTIASMERNKYNPSLALCIELAKALKADLNSLFWEGD
ncbi:helix-turn-helix transcriptional regulator [Bacillus thuringiensis]|uniref:helix-turn-helix transcriptional regulator n=1 Tax=Bacillus thuringiensis TaxID=1428 RepID=UPI0021759FC3|nr:helix-turn-helix transcriptional regulator [Bacillus thuringiensis]